MSLCAFVWFESRCLSEVPLAGHHLCVHHGRFDPRLPQRYLFKNNCPCVQCLLFFVSIDLAIPAYPSLLGIGVFALFLLLLLVALVCLSLCVCLGCEVSKRSACVYGKRCPSLQADAMWGARRKDSASKLRITRRLTPTKNEKRSRSHPAYFLRLPPLSCRSALTRAHCSAKSPPGPPRGFPPRHLELRKVLRKRPGKP